MNLSKRLISSLLAMVIAFNSCELISVVAYAEQLPNQTIVEENIYKEEPNTPAEEPPATEEEPPTEEEKPNEDIVPPVEEIPPVDEVIPPNEETVPPAEEITPPTEEIKPPKEENVGVEKCSYEYVLEYSEDFSSVLVKGNILINTDDLNYEIEEIKINDAVFTKATAFEITLTENGIYPVEVIDNDGGFFTFNTEITEIKTNVLKLKDVFGDYFKYQPIQWDLVEIVKSSGEFIIPDDGIYAVSIIGNNTKSKPIDCTPEHFLYTEDNICKECEEVTVYNGLITSMFDFEKGNLLNVEISEKVSIDEISMSIDGLIVKGYNSINTGFSYDDERNIIQEKYDIDDTAIVIIEKYNGIEQFSVSAPVDGTIKVVDNYEYCYRRGWSPTGWHIFYASSGWGCRYLGGSEILDSPKENIDGYVVNCLSHTYYKLGIEFIPEWLSLPSTGSYENAFEENNITSIPETLTIPVGVGDVTGMFKKNKIKNIPKTFILPETIYSCSSLFSYNEIETIPETFNIPLSVEYMSSVFSYNKIKAIPDTFRIHNNVENTSALFCNNLIEEIPPDLFNSNMVNLTDIRSMYWNNKIKNIPENFYIPNSVKTISALFSENEFETVPGNFYIPNSVTEANSLFKSNKIKTIHEDFRLPEGLVDISAMFYENEFETIPGNFYIPNSVTEAYSLFSGNKIKAIPETFELPDGIVNVSNMFYDNLLTEIPINLFKPSMVNLKNINGIYLNNNITNLSELPYIPKSVKIERPIVTVRSLKIEKDFKFKNEEQYKGFLGITYSPGLISGDANIDGIDYMVFADPRSIVISDKNTSYMEYFKKFNVTPKIVSKVYDDKPDIRFQFGGNQPYLAGDKLNITRKHIDGETLYTGNDYVVAKYRFDNNPWVDFDESWSPINIEPNIKSDFTFEIYVKDFIGNDATWTYKIDVDREPPVKPDNGCLLVSNKNPMVVKTGYEAGIRRNVILKNPDIDTVTLEFKFNDKDWSQITGLTEYTTVPITEAGTLRIRLKDSNGNVSEEDVYQFELLDGDPKFRWENDPTTKWYTNLDDINFKLLIDGFNEASIIRIISEPDDDRPREVIEINPLEEDFIVAPKTFVNSELKGFIHQYSTEYKTETGTSYEWGQIKYDPKTDISIKYLNGIPTEYTAGPVTIEVGDIDVGISGWKEFSFDNGATWQTTYSKEFTENYSSYVLFKNNADIVSQPFKLVIDKIDKEAPSVEQLNEPNTEWHHEDEIIKFNITDDVSGIKSVSIKEKVLDISKDGDIYSVTAIENGTYTLSVEDNFGRITEKVFTISKIDKSKPNIDSIDLTTVDWTNQDITATLSTSNIGISGIKDLTVNNIKVTESNDEFVIKQNGTYIVKLESYSGLFSDVYIVEVANIDKTNPVVEFKRIDTEDFTNKDAEVELTFKDLESGIKSYEATSNSNISYVETATGLKFTVTDNDTIQFKAINNAGGVTQSSFIISNIDKTAPELSITEQPLDIWVADEKYYIIHSFDLNPDTFEIECSVSDVTLEQLTDNKIKVKSNVNQDVKIISTDKAGNISELTLVFDKIDTENPKLSIENIEQFSEFKQEYTLNVKASDNQSGVAGILLNGVKINSDEYSEVIRENKTIKLQAVDNSGKVSEELILTIDKQDNTKPTIDKVDIKPKNIKPEPFKLSKLLSKIYNDSIDIIIEYNDNLSGVSKVEYKMVNEEWEELELGKPLSILKEYKGLISLRVTDRAGNISDVFEIDLIVDAYPPVILVTPETDKWITTNRKITIDFKDAVSNIEKIILPNGVEIDNINSNTYSLDMEVGNGDYKFTAEDSLGNISEVIYKEEKIEDIIPEPPTSEDLEIPKDEWFNPIVKPDEPVPPEDDELTDGKGEIVIDTDKIEAPSGISKLLFKVDKMNLNDNNLIDESIYDWSVYDGKIALDTDGVFDVYFKVETNAGNVTNESKNRMKLDFTKPTLKANSKPSYVSYTVDDNLSGVKEIICSHGVFTDVDVQHTCSFDTKARSAIKQHNITVVDNAGNRRTYNIEPGKSDGGVWVDDDETNGWGDIGKPNKDKDKGDLDDKKDEITLPDNSENILNPSLPEDEREVTIDKNGNIVDKNGNILDNNGNIVEIDKDGNLINNNGNIIDRDGNVLIKDDKGNLKDKSGNTVDRNGDKVTIDSNGNLINGNGNTIDRNGNEVTIDKNGNLINKDGEFVDRNGNLVNVGKDGELSNKDGDFIDRNGNDITYDEYLNLLDKNLNLIDRNGNKINLDENLNISNALNQLIDRNGNQVTLDKNGNLINKDGEVINRQGTNVNFINGRVLKTIYADLTDRNGLLVEICENCENLIRPDGNEINLNGIKIGNCNQHSELNDDNYSKYLATRSIMFILIIILLAILFKKYSTFKNSKK